MFFFDYNYVWAQNNDVEGKYMNRMMSVLIVEGDYLG